MALTIQEKVQLKPYNTLQLSAVADYFIQIQDTQDLIELTKHPLRATHPIMILGQGSNTLFSRDYPGLIALMQMSGKEVIAEDDSTLEVKVAAGEDWHGLVTWAVEKNLGGIENLALIPGTVGAAPVQNIAAYGQNFSDSVVLVETLDVETAQIQAFKTQDCQFGYRSSIFKQADHKKQVITSVTLKLHKHPELETSYYSIGGKNDSLTKELTLLGQEPYTIQHVYQAVMAIRQRKLLDWKSQPTVGSFFINPVVSKAKVVDLSQKIENLQTYPIEQLHYQTQVPDQEYVKVPVGRLLDELGWRGKVIGNCMVSDKLASILTHNGQATGEEFLSFANTIKQDVLDNYGIELETEVNII